MNDPSPPAKERGRPMADPDQQHGNLQTGDVNSVDQRLAKLLVDLAHEVSKLIPSVEGPKMWREAVELEKLIAEKRRRN
ncbi:MAG: hypothetical protein C5B58_16000 [Acidobacteria bacterium]|nr:MAG: hypothetical protein C5B58_16000 [Acidobacteriota bacterium]